MKRIFAIVAVAILAVQCSKKEQQPEVEEQSAFTPPKQEVAVVEGDKALPGYALINGSDCLSCHKDSEKFIGPSYAEVAAKYTAADADLLASKIIDGGSGVWGQVPMQAHPNITKDEAKKMVEYILSMK